MAYKNPKYKKYKFIRDVNENFTSKFLDEFGDGSD